MNSNISSFLFLTFFQLFFPVLFIMFINLQNVSKNESLTKIIIIGEQKYRYVNLVITQKERTLLVETTSYPGDSCKIFIGLRTDGEYYFLDNEIHN